MTSEFRPSRRLRELVDLACTDQLTEQPRLELDQLLRESDQNCDFYLAYCRLHAEVALLTRADHASLSVFAAVQAQLDSTPSPASLRWRRAWEAFYGVISDYMALSVLLSTIFMAILLLSMGLITLDVPEERPPDPNLTIVAEVTATREAVWDKTSIANFRDVELFSDEHLVLNSGMAEVTFRNGAVVLLEGPVTFAVRSSGAGSLESGKLFAKVPPAAIGFTVSTPTAEIVDLGTEFGVEVDQAGNTLAEVLEGAIDVKRVDGARVVASMKLRTGDAAQVNVAGRGITSVTARGQFAARLPERVLPAPPEDRPDQTTDEPGPLLPPAPGHIPNGDFSVNKPLSHGWIYYRGIDRSQVGWTANRSWMIADGALVKDKHEPRSPREFVGTAFRAGELTGTGWRLEYDLAGSVGVEYLRVYGAKERSGNRAGDRVFGFGNHDPPEAAIADKNGWVLLLNLSKPAEGQDVQHVIRDDLSRFDLIAIKICGGEGSARIDNLELKQAQQDDKTE